MIEARFHGRLGDFSLNAGLSVPAEGVTGLVGPSGSGKSTLLRCMAGLTRLNGRMTIGDEVWQDERRFRAPHLRPVGFVFQETALLAHLSVRGNLLYGYRRSRDARRFAFDEVVQLLALGPLLKRGVAKLSGGERQRVAIGRALLSQPELLLMDEPLSSLDLDAKAEIMPYLDRIHQTLSIPVVYVSHDPAEIARLADRVLIMREGRIVVAAPAATLSEADARRTLAGMDKDRVAQLALAALLAGLEPMPGPNSQER
jgi:molybdate transport system ATP-binding protein